MAEIFISYRRDDARAEAGRLHDRLAARFGHRQVFMDVDDIAPGEDFEQRLQATLGSCVAVVVVIGRDWLGRDPVTGSTRVADPGDFVHIEVRAALARDIPVFPVLVDGATMPARAEIPDALAPLLTRHAIELRDARFSDDVAPLIKALSAVTHQRARRLPRHAVVVALCAALVLGASFLGYRLLRSDAMQLRSEPAPMTSAAVSAMLVRHDFFDARRNAAGRGPTVRLEPRVIGDAVVVVDRSTRLMWQQAGTGGPQVFADAAATIGALNEAAYAGFDDWRLPTLAESMSLMRPQARAGAFIDPAFRAGAAPFVWTADRLPPDRGWVVYYYDGFCTAESDRFNASVRAVRTLRR